MSTDKLFSLKNRRFTVSLTALVVIFAIAAFIGLVLLPKAHARSAMQSMWEAICSAVGAPAPYQPGGLPDEQQRYPSNVIVHAGMMAAGEAASVGKGATLAMACTMCHGAQGMSTSNSPNLAGQYPEVVIKQLLDYKSGRRSHALMEALARGLSERDIEDLAAYYGSLAKARTAPTTYDESLPALVRVGDPLRNIAPCISCHGGVDQKLGAPWIEGMPRDYLVEQLRAFRSGTRRNNALAQMRNMARPMTDREIDEVAGFYARKAAPGGH